MQVNDILKERQETHGDFSTQATMSQCLKKRCGGRALYELEPIKAEALEMILHKVSRILNGNSNFKDHWDDIAGYATLVSNRLSTHTKVPTSEVSTTAERKKPTIKD